MYTLNLTAVLDGVTQLLPVDSLQDPYYYTFTVKCTSCQEVHPKPVSFHRWTKFPLTGSRGDANFVWRCGFCKRENSAIFTSNPVHYDESEVDRPIIEFDCRGLEFIKFIPDGEWQAKGTESNTFFRGIDLQEGDWYDYDEKTGQQVSVTSLEWKFERC